jgi:hypothetical protein
MKLFEIEARAELSQESSSCFRTPFVLWRAGLSLKWLKMVLSLLLSIGA